MQRGQQQQPNLTARETKAPQSTEQQSADRAKNSTADQMIVSCLKLNNEQITEYSNKTNRALDYTYKISS